MAKWVDLTGIHLPNGPIRDRNGMLAVGFKHFTMLDGEAGHIPTLRQVSPGGIILVRFYQPRWSDLDPVTWADHCVAEYDRDRGGWSMRSMGCHITPANEMNLEEEGGGSTQEWYERINAWLNRWLDRVGNRISREKLHFPAFAYGHSDDDNTRGYCGMEICRSAIERFGILDCHPYWFAASEVELDWRGHRFIRAHGLFPTMPIFCSEAGGFDPLRPTMPQEMVQWFRSLERFPYIVGATPFIWEDPTGAHQVNDWSRNPAIAQAVRAAIAAEDGASGGGGAPSGGDTMTEAELLRLAADIFRRAGQPWNPNSAIAKKWLSDWKAGVFRGAPSGPEHPSENGRYMLQEFASAVLVWDSQTGEVSDRLPLPL